METITREKCDILAMPRTVTVYPAVFPYTVQSVLEPISKASYTEASSGRSFYESSTSFSSLMSVRHSHIN
jgi:hypothetical protein